MILQLFRLVEAGRSSRACYRSEPTLGPSRFHTCSGSFFYFSGANPFLRRLTKKGFPVILFLTTYPARDCDMLNGRGGTTKEHLAACHSPRDASQHLAHCTQSTDDRRSFLVFCRRSHRISRYSFSLLLPTVPHKRRDAHAYKRRDMLCSISDRDGHSHCGNVNKSWWFPVKRLWLIVPHVPQEIKVLLIRRVLDKPQF